MVFGMSRVGRTGEPFEVLNAVISSDFVAVVDVVMERGRFCEEGFSDEAMGEFGDLTAVADKTDVEVTVMDGSATEINACGFVTKASERRDFVAREAVDGEPDFGSDF